LDVDIIYQDQYIVAINKPHGLLVHRSAIAADAEEFALQKLRDHLKQKVFLVHRIDRKTSGVLLFALSSDINKYLSKAFAERTMHKGYHAIVRGWLESDILVDYPLINDKGKVQDAITHFYPIQKAEIDVPLGLYKTSRYTFIKAIPKTGRMHQIRKHLNHLRHPIVGDRPHGCSKQNRMWKKNYNMTLMMLHASELVFDHPITGEKTIITATKSNEMQRVMNILKIKKGM